jgi:uroporphyrinogen III methyltransferase/synthase
MSHDSKALGGNTNNTVLPLSGRTILITRARQQAAAFAVQLERYGARVIACPTIEISDPESYSPLDEAIESLYGYDWLIFTSVNGVDYFMRRFRSLRGENAEVAGVNICALGSATAERLREFNLRVDVVPEQFKAEGVYTALEHFMGGQQGLRGLSFLIPRASAARDYLPTALREAGARVDVVAAYRTLRPESSERGRLDAMLSGGGIDCVAFTSSSTVINFASLFDTTDLGRLLHDVAIACIGDITAKTAGRYQLNTDILPEQYTIPALAQAIAAYYSALG